MDDSGYLVPDARRRSSANRMQNDPYNSGNDPDEHHYEPLEPAKDDRKKGRTWRIFGTARRRSRSLGPNVGRLFRRSTISEVDFENHWKSSKSESTKHKVSDIIVGHEVGTLDEKQLMRYRSRKMSTPSFASTHFNGSQGSGFRGPLDRIPSVGSLAAATLPPVPNRQPALPPRRYSEASTLHAQRAIEDGNIYPRPLSNESSEDELQILRYRVEVLERRLAGELDNEDFKVLVDDRGESSTDDVAQTPAIPKPSVINPLIPTVSDTATYAKPNRRGNLQRRAMSSGDISVASIAPRLSVRRRSRQSDWATRQESFKAIQGISSDGMPSQSTENITLNATRDTNHAARDTNYAARSRFYSRSISSQSDNVFTEDSPYATCGSVEQLQSGKEDDDDVHVQSSSTWYSRNFGLVKREASPEANYVESSNTNDPVFSETLAKGVTFQDSHYDESRPVTSFETFRKDSLSVYQGPILTSHGIIDGTTSPESLYRSESLDSDSTIKDVDFNEGIPPLLEGSFLSRSADCLEADLSQDDYVSRTRAKSRTTMAMGMELPFGRTSSNGPLPNGSMDPSPITPPQDTDLGEYVNIRVRIADTDTQKSVCFKKDEKIWNMKQHILQCPDVELKDSRNYGFYMLPQNNKAGKFLDEERLLSDYPLDHKKAYLEFRYKKRVYRQLNVDVHQLKKFHTRSNLKQFLEYIRTRHLEKLNKMLDKGLDPNFHEESTGETPLTIAIMTDRSEEIIKALVNGGAHLDFRNRHSFTPVHLAVQKGNSRSLDILLDLGASPNAKDDRGLTPLYYSIVSNTETQITELLLKDCAEVTPVDSQGWGLIHHACRYGRSRALKLLLLYGSNISSANEAGNTPLHVSALYNQEHCALMLLDRGADRGTKNKANQTAFQVAILANNFDLAEVIRNHSGQIPGAYSKKYNSQDTPTFSKRRRWNSYVSQTQSLSQMRGQAFLEQSDDRYGPRSRLSLATIRGSPDRGIGNGSAGGLGRTQAPMVHRKIKEAPKGKFYIAKQNYTAQEVGELSLHSGDHVEVTAIGEYNFWQGLVAHSMGWFPSYCVEEISPKYRKSSSRQNLAQEEPITNSVPSFDGVASEPKLAPRISCVQRGKKGFGFVLRGAKSSHGSAVSFTPTKDFPALQYLEHVDKGSPADKAGLKMGDFILEINGEDVSSAPHQYVVNLVISSPDTIVMKVVTVPGSKAYSWLKDGGGTLKRQAPSIPVTSPANKTPSVSSAEQKAVDELDLAIESASTTPKYVSPSSSRSPSLQGDEPRVASIRKRPIRHQVSQHDLEGIFHRQGSTSSDSAAHATHNDPGAHRPTVPVPPPMNKYNTVARMSNVQVPQQSPEELQSPIDRRNSGGSDSAVSSLRSSPASSHSFMTSSTVSVTDSAVHLKTERTSSDPILAIDVTNNSPQSLQGNVKKPSPLPPTRSQSLLNLSLANSGNNSPEMRHGGGLQKNDPMSASVNTMAVEIDVHRSASGNDSDDSSSTSSFASAIALAAANMDKKKVTVEDKPLPKSSSAFEMAMAAKQTYAQSNTEGQNLNRNQNQNVESPSSTQAALQQAIAKRKMRLEGTAEKKPEDIEERIKWYKQQDKASKQKTGQAAFLDAIAKRRMIVETQNNTPEDDSWSESTPNLPMNRVAPAPPKPSPELQTRNESNTSPLNSEITKAACAMQEKIANRPPIKEDNSLSRHKNVIRISPRNASGDSPDSSSGQTISVKNLKQSFEKSKKLSPRDAKVSPLSPVKEDETLTDAALPPPAAFLENGASIPHPKTDAGYDDSHHRFTNGDKDSHHMDIDILPPPPSFVEDADHARFRRDQPYDTASVMSSASSISTMSSYSTMSTDPSSNDGFEAIGEESLINSNTMKSDTSSSGSSSSTSTVTGITTENDNWARTAPPVSAKPSKTSRANENEISHSLSNGNDNDPLKGKGVSDWTVDDVGMWLERLQLGEYRESFTENAICGEHLTALGKDDLSELGVKRLGHRLTIVKALQKLQN